MVAARVTPLPRVPRRDDGRVDLDAVVAALRPWRPQLLETVPGTPGAGRWSYVALAGGRLTDDGTRTRLTLPGRASEDLGPDPFVALDVVGDRYGWTPDGAREPDHPPFTDGLVGTFGYDLGRRIEDLPTVARRDRDVGHLDLVVATTVVAVDHASEEAWCSVRDLEGPPTPARPDVAARLAAASSGAVPVPPVAPGPVRTTLPRAAYEAAVAAVLAHVAAGDTFQVNLTQRLTGHWPGDVHALYRALRRESPAAFGAALGGPPGGGVASVSPETFLHVEGRRVRTRPIKGTRPRHPDPARDRAAGRALTRSAKDRAENVMVIDMERNDLGRVCRPGTVTVPRLLELEAHPTVWHLVSTVEGELRDGVGYGALLRATFPCGSVTGTPKVRAMEVIEGLEPVGRGVYCGAIGFVAAGAMSTSVAIRTASLSADGTVDYGAGGGVVADSDPAAEHAESLDKAAAFLRAVGATAILPWTS